MKMLAIDWIFFRYDPLHSSKQLAGFKSDVVEQFGTGRLEHACVDGRIKFGTKEAVRTGDEVKIRLAVTNNTGDLVSLAVTSKATSDGPTPFSWDSGRVEDHFIGQGATSDDSISLYLPESSKYLMARIEYRMDARGDYCQAIHTITF